LVQLEPIGFQDAFELYDTFGFPIDLTALILKENGLNYNEKEFINLLDTQKNRSKAAHVNSNEEWVSVLDSNETEFIGYDNLRANIRILKYRKSITKNGDTVFQLVFDSTPFYPQGGGQVGDKGHLILDKNEIIEIQNTVKENDTIIHECKKLPNDLNSSYEVIVDKDKRFDSSCNHTSTHLLHDTLRKILGDHVQQKGSMVSEKYLRFDFSHYEKLTSQQVTSIQNLVNEKIDEQHPLEENREANYEDCIKNGVIALFGEKYGDVVRSVKFGNSYELCGGTHVANTGLIKNFIIKSESAISSGIRRIEAISGNVAKDFLEQKLNTLDQLSSMLNNDKDLVSALNKIKTQNNLLNKKLENANKELIEFYLNTISNNSLIKNGINVSCLEIGCSPEMLKNLSFSYSKKNDKIFLVLVAKNKDKVYLTCYISKEIVNEENFNANTIVKSLSKHINGSGGGQPFFASASGNNIQGVGELLQEALKII
jgi:alanyl-tRNA synthetase